MMQYYKANLCVEASWLVESGVMTESNYRSLSGRRDIIVARRGCRGVTALVDYESLPGRFKESIVRLLGNPYDYVKENALVRYVSPSPEAADYFDSYLVDGVRHLPQETIRRYHAEACILDGIGRLISERRGKTSALGHRKAKLWDDLTEMVSLLDNVRWPHTLPTNARSLERKYKAYVRDGYGSLIHKNWKGRNVAVRAQEEEQTAEEWSVADNMSKIRTQPQRDALLDYMSDPRNLSDPQVADLYNVLARQNGWETVCARTIGVWRRANEQEIFARLHGATRFRAERSMTVKRSAPSAPLYLWTLDGWDAELLYQKTTTDKKGHSVTTYHNRVKLEVILDACTKYPIGFAIGDTESPELVRAALRNAINHTRELFGARFKPAQIQMDHAGFKSLEQTYRQTAKFVTPAAVRNAKAKIIEPWFRSFNDRYCHLQTNWSGYGLTANKDLQPNTEYINKFRHSFPDRDGVVAQLTKFINAERARLHDEFLQKWNDMPVENRFPMTDEQYLLAYGTRTEHTYLLRNTGIKITLPKSGGRTLDFDCFSHEFRRHASVRWTVIYDPDDTSVAIAVNEDETLRFALEEKHVQPMALIERTEGDAAHLQRVRDFNRAEEQRIADTFAAIDTTDPLRIGGDTATLPMSPELEVLSKLLIVDSDGQHKAQKDKARLLAEGAVPADVDVLELY